MVTSWGIYCDWAIVLYEIAMTLSLAFYIYVSMCAFDHYHCGFELEHLKKKELHRMEVKYHRQEGEMRIKKEKADQEKMARSKSETQDEQTSLMYSHNLN